MKKNILLLLLPCVLLTLSAQSLNSISVQEEKQKLLQTTTNDSSILLPSPQLAMSSSDYPVTAGDIYTLAFAAGNTPITYNISVDTSYKVRIANLAVLDASEMTFIQLKQQVEQIVTKNYPMSGVQFVILTPAIFKVTINGEVKETSIKQAWALTRLSTIVKDLVTTYSSTRDIQVTSANGKKHTYDLFQASRFGDLSQDPYIKPGDIITIKRMSRKVTISGAVERPGTYELIKGENLKSLIEYYGGGINPYADLSQIILSRILTGSNNSGEKKYLEKSVLNNDYVLLNQDLITIGSISELKSFVSIEGIISLKDSISDKTNITTNEEKLPNTVEKIKVSFLHGENYADFIRRNQTLFNSYSDLINSYVERDSIKIPLNLEHILFNTDYISNIFVEPNDKLVIPFQQYLTKIYVSGEVQKAFEVDAWPLKRLTEILEPVNNNLTEFSSTRDIEVISVDGVSSIYDLFQASRFGDLNNNPYIRAGEKVIINRISRKVTINGAIERPGTYELLDTENIKQLLNYYAGGLKSQADINRSELTRVLEDNSKTGKKIYLAQKDYDNDYPLICYDYINIPSYEDLKPVVFIEGAIYADQTTAPEASTRISVNYTPGENYATFVRRNKQMFSATSDTVNAYIIRGGKTIPINIDKMLFDVSYISEQYLNENDTLMIPFRQYFISVAGAVVQPGRYPFIPDRDWSYYIGLAGGFTTQNYNNDITIKNIYGDELKKGDPLTPEATITAKYNSFTFYFNQYAPVISTILSAITTIYTIVAVMMPKS